MSIEDCDHDWGLWHQRSFNNKPWLEPERMCVLCGATQVAVDAGGCAPPVIIDADMKPTTPGIKAPAGQ